MPFQAKESQLKVFSGCSNQQLAERIAGHLGKPLGRVTTKRFSDGEIWVKYEESIRGTDIFIVQSTHPPAENFMELLIMCDAARRASAARITAVIPYFGYARQDRKDQPRVSISAKLMANLLVQSGANRVLTLDLHAPQIQGFFDIPFDHLYGARVFVDHFNSLALKDVVIVSPDIGGVHLSRAYAARLNTEMAVLNKKRIEHNQCIVTEFIGDVQDKNVLIVDDLVDTAGTLVNGVQVLKTKGARNIYVASTHPVLSGKAIERLQQSCINKAFFTDSIYVPPEKQIDKMEILSVSYLLSEAILRIHRERSISDLFMVSKSPMH
ncbi:MAG: ribose-phosphate pyrophosphokinase [candidate division KSB1 bacterium]|nr:ribose-phosphate pyrophosphokinase [candidate division KSB1 bacterium]